MLLLAYIFSSSRQFYSLYMPSPINPQMRSSALHAHRDMSECVWGQHFHRPVTDLPTTNLSSFALPYFDGSIRADHKTSVGRRARTRHHPLESGWFVRPLFLRRTDVQTDAGSQRARNARQKGLAEAG